MCVYTRMTVMMSYTGNNTYCNTSIRVYKGIIKYHMLADMCMTNYLYLVTFEGSFRDTGNTELYCVHHVSGVSYVHNFPAIFSETEFSRILILIWNIIFLLTQIHKNNNGLFLDTCQRRCLTAIVRPSVNIFPRKL